MLQPGAVPGSDLQAATLDLAKQLIARPSLTPDDAGCLDIVAARLAAAGFTCERLDRGGVGNLWARRGTGAPLVAFAGHVDVVPAGPAAQWTGDPFTPVVRDGLLFGRGAADMKGSVAAMVVALERWTAANPAHPGSVALLLTSDEEGDAVHGTAAAVEALAARGVAIDACIVGEPTSVAQLGDTMKVGRRGSLNGVLTVRGVQCHIAYPELGLNAVHAALPALAELAGLEWDAGTGAFPPTRFQISNVHAGTGAVNVVPGTCDVLFNIRFSPASTPEAIQSRVREVLDRHGLTYELRWTLSAMPFSTPAGALVDTLAAAVREVTGLTPELSTSGGTSDGRFLAAISRELVEFGPVNRSMHAVDEHVRVEDLGRLAGIFSRTLDARIAR
ncbi:MAG: succinyl-diaminopimelate desuccinylase [Vicinamibacterales bacterium]